MQNGNSDVSAAPRAAAQEPPARRPPTAADVARLAQVSRSTVSLAMNQVPDSRIPEETRKRVLVAAEQLGYVPHAAASALRGGRSRLVLIPFHNRPHAYVLNLFYDHLAGRLTELGYTVMFHRDRAASVLDRVRQWASLRPIGVIAEAYQLDDQAIDLLHRVGTRAVLTGSWVVTDREDPGWIGRAGVYAAEHLIAAGHRWLAAVVPREPDLSRMGLERLAGVELVAQRHEVPVERIDLELDARGASALAETWQRNPHPTGVFAYNDEYAMVLMRALLDAGLAIPGEVAVIGCDNLWFCDFLRPRLTSISMHPDIGGRALADRLHAMILGAPREPLDMGPPTIIVRDSA